MHSRCLLSTDYAMEGIVRDTKKQAHVVSALKELVSVLFWKLMTVTKIGH